MSIKNDPMGQRIKGYEKVETERRLDPTLPIIIRLDGRGFSKFTRNLTKPFCPFMTLAMIQTCKHLVEHTHAKVGYAQSDEISLVYTYEGEAQPLFGGKVHKLNSVLAGLATAVFNAEIYKGLASKFLAWEYPHFDCRAFNVPSLDEATNVILWRYFDAYRNAVSAIAQSLFSHRELHGKTTKDKLSMLSANGVDVEDYTSSNIHGTLMFRRNELVPSIDGVVERQRVKIRALPLRDVANRVGYLFGGESPLYGE